jgi:hypothetical protein
MNQSYVQGQDYVENLLTPRMSTLNEPGDLSIQDPDLAPIYEGLPDLG